MNNNGEIRAECIKVVQGGMQFFTFVMNSRTLREISYVSKREITNPSGYQRFLNNKRLRDVGDYIKKPRATFPNSIILNLDPLKARFEPSPDGKRGTIVIHKDENVAWIIDGQHRLFGFGFSEGKEFDLIVSAFLGLSINDQATIFKVINSTQVGVSPSLIYDLIDLTKDAEYLDKRAHEIIKALNDDEDSPWRGKIKMLGIGKGIISQAAFIGSLKTLLQNSIFKEYDEGEQIKILKDYFSVLRNLFPRAWDNPKYILCKTLGVAATLLIMPKVLTHCVIKSSFTTDTMRTILQGVPDIEIHTPNGIETIDFSGNQLGAYSGRKGQRKLSEILESKLPPLRPDVA